MTWDEVPVPTVVVESSYLPLILGEWKKGCGRWGTWGIGGNEDETPGKMMEGGGGGNPSGL